MIHAKEINERIYNIVLISIMSRKLRFDRFDNYDYENVNLDEQEFEHTGAKKKKVQSSEIIGWTGVVLMAAGIVFFVMSPGIANDLEQYEEAPPCDATLDNYVSATEVNSVITKCTYESPIYEMWEFWTGIGTFLIGLILLVVSPGCD